MSLPKFSVNHSLFVNLVSGIVMVIGAIVLLGLNREIFPNVAFDTVSVTTFYPGATPLDVEKLITVPIEKELREVDGIKEIKSSSTAGASLLMVKIDPDDRDKQKVVRDIQNAVDRVKDLPGDILDDPVAVEITSRQYPIIEVWLAGKMSGKKLQEYADALADELEDIKGVARAKKAGYREREIQVLVDPVKMRDYYVSFDEMERALAARNVSVPAGKINTETTEYGIRTTGEFTTLEEVESVIIRSNDSGNWLRVKDVAEVRDSFKKEDVISKTWGTRSVNLVILKKESGDAISVVEEIKKRCGSFQRRYKDPPEISYVNDYSFFAKRRLNVLTNNGWLSFVIVIGCMVSFLQVRVALMAVLGIPIAMLSTFIVMNMMGITINLISMFGLIIVLGMLVDDGIIVAENVYRHMEEGLPPREAAVKGTEEVMGAINAAVFTTIASFSPLLFMSGIIGKFIRNIPAVVIIALLASLTEAFIVLPSHLADFVRVRRNSLGEPVKHSKDVPWFKNILDSYTRIVKAGIRRRYFVVTIFICVLVLCVFLAGSVLKFVLFPSAGVNFFFIRAEAPIGTPVGRTNELIAPVESIVAEIPREELESFVTTVGQISEDRHDPFAGMESNFVQIAVYLTPEQDRKRNAEEIIEELREKTKNITGFDDLRFDKAESGPPVGKAVEAKIRGENFDKLDTIADEYMDYLKTINGTSDVTWDYKPGKEEIRVKVDHEKATVAGLTIGQVAKTIRAVFEGSIATTIKPVKAEEETDVTIMFPEEAEKDVSVFEEILVMNKYGNLIPLKKIANIEKVPGTTTIHHLDGKRVVTASCDVEDNKTTAMEVNRKLAREFRDISHKRLGYSVKYGGELEETIESLVSLLKAFFFAALVIYLILASFFRSIIQPFVVMLAIPFGLIGVVFAFLTHGLPFSFMAIMGVVGLSGIVVNDSIVLISFINNLRESGMSRYDSIIKAGQMRLRPVILTTTTTVGGLSTVAYGIGGKDPFLVPMALSITWGLLFSTVLTLILIPCIYSIIDDLTMKITHHTSMIKIAHVE